MEQIKKGNRKFKQVTSDEGIDRVLSKYVDLSKLHLKNSVQIIPVRFLDRPDKTQLLLNFSEEVVSKTVTLFTMANRYLEFTLKILEKAEETYPEHSYLAQITQCLIAEDKRQFRRYNAINWEVLTNHITVLNMRETPVDIVNSVSFQVFYRECERGLTQYDYKSLFHADERNLTAEKRFATELKKSIFIEDMTNTEEFFSEHSSYFEENPEKGNALKARLVELAKYRSILIQPINYLAIDERQFPIGYIMIATEEQPLGDDDRTYVDSLIKETCEKIRDANQEMHNIRAKVIDISPAGCLIHIRDKTIGRIVSAQNYVLFSLVFKLQQPIRISARVIHAERESESSYYIGLNFRGSGFGPKAEKLIENHIKKCIREHSPG